MMVVIFEILSAVVGLFYLSRPKIHVISLAFVGGIQAFIGYSILFNNSGSKILTFWNVISLIIPSILVLLVLFMILGLILYLSIIPIQYFTHFLQRLFHTTKSFKNVHVFITGGATGLGKATAEQLIKEGAFVTIVSRNESHLKTAFEELELINKNHSQYFVCDVTDPQAMEITVQNAIKGFQGKPIELVITSAGLAHPSLFLSNNRSSFELLCKREMDLNYHGTINALTCIVPQMAKLRRGNVVMVSSGYGIVGGVGYTAYSASKYALRGFAESLRFELEPLGIGVHIFYPSNMNTPGFEEENKTKPLAAWIIEGRTATKSAKDAASCLLDSVRCGEFAITNTLDLELVRLCGNGVTPSPRPVLELFMTPFIWITIGIQRLLWENVFKHNKDILTPF